MRQCMVDLKAGRQVPREFLESCRKEGCQVCFRVRGESSGRDVLILTDSQETARWAAASGIACVGYECPGEDGPLYGVGLVVQDLGILTFPLLERAYRRYHGIPWEIARTARLVIRESIPEDFEELYAMYQEPDFCRYTPGMTGDRDKEREYFQAYVQNRYGFYGYGLWTVLEGDTGQLVGRAGLEDRDTPQGSVLEAGYAIGKPWQNRGYATEAMGAVLCYAEDELEAKRVFAFIKPDNLPSVRVAGKLGMTEVSPGCFCRRLGQGEKAR